MEPVPLETLLTVVKGLADATRLKVLGLVAERERCVRDLATTLRLTEPTISHHLARLQTADLVHMRREGTTHYYRLNHSALQQLHKAFRSPERVGSLAATVEGTDAWERKVLHTFVQQGRLTKIPAMRKKRSVILKWLANQFRNGVRYPERELNTIIKRCHWDCATLRREMIANRLMQREHGIYWRLPPTA